MVKPRPAGLLSLLLLALAACAGAGQAPAEVHGRVMRSAACGNRADLGERCEPKPLSIPLRIRDRAGRLVLELRSDADGGFHFQLPPGEYRLEFAAPGPFRQPAQALRLTPGENPFLNLRVELGLR